MEKIYYGGPGCSSEPGCSNVTTAVTSFVNETLKFQTYAKTQLFLPQNRRSFCNAKLLNLSKKSELT